MTIALYLLFNLNTAINLPQEFTVKKVIDNHHIQSMDLRTQRLPWITFPDKVLYPDRFDACHYLHVQDYLRDKLTSETVRIDPNRVSLLSKKEDILETILKSGYAHIESNSNTPPPDNLVLAEQQAKQNRLGIWAGCRQYHGKKRPTQHPHLYHNQTTSTVRDVIESSTLLLDNGKKVRLQYIKPTIATHSPAHRCIADEAKNRLKALLVGRHIIMQKDKNSHDSFSTIERHVYLPPPSPKTKPIYINRWLVTQGLAEPTHHPIVKNWQPLVVKAIKKNRGAWGKCQKSILSWLDPSPKNASLNQSNCAIKGNISGTKSNPVKKYHTSESPWYERVIAERCFDDEETAVNEGFVKVR